MENFIVTFARGFGTGGKEIASMLAKDLNLLSSYHALTVCARVVYS